MEAASIDALIAQGYTRVQAIKIYYQQNLKSQPAKVVEPTPACASPQPFVRDAITRIKSQMNPVVDPLNPPQPRREFGADSEDFETDAARALAVQQHIVKQQNAEVERKVAQLRAMNEERKAMERKPLNLRPLASIHGRSGFVDKEDPEDDVHEVEPIHDELELNHVNGHAIPNLSPSMVESSPSAFSPGAPSPRTTTSVNSNSESEQFIANLVAQGYKRDEAFLMYLRKVNADKADKDKDSRSRRNSRTGPELQSMMGIGSRSGGDLLTTSRSGADLLTNNNNSNADASPQMKHVFLDTTTPTDKKQDKTFYKFLNNALSTESIDLGEVAPSKSRSSDGTQSKHDEAHIAQIQQMQEQQQQLLRQLEAQKEQARQIAEEQQNKLLAQQAEYEKQKQLELQEQTKKIEQMEQQRIQQEHQQRIIAQQQEEQKRLLEEQQAQWLAQQKQLQENLLLQQAQFQEAQAEKLREQERKLAEHQLFLQKQHEEKLNEQKSEQARMLEEIQIAKKLELQLAERERQKQMDMVEQKRLIDQLEQQRLQQEEQHQALLRQQAEQKRLAEEQQQAWIEQQKRLQDKLLEQQLEFQRQQAEMQAEQQRKLEEHKLFLQQQAQEQMVEQAREQARLAEELLKAKQDEALIEQRKLEKERKLLAEQLEAQRQQQERHQQALEEQSLRMQQKHEELLAKQLEEQERQRQEMMEQKLLDKQQYQLQQQLLFNQQQQQLQQQSQHQQFLGEQRTMLEVQQKQQENQQLAAQQQQLQFQEQRMKMEMSQYEHTTRMTEMEASIAMNGRRSKINLLQKQKSEISELSDDSEEVVVVTGAESPDEYLNVRSRSGELPPHSPQQNQNKLEQLRKSRIDVNEEPDFEDANAAYLSTSGKMTRGPPVWNTMSPSRSAYNKDDNSPYGFGSTNSKSQMMMGMQPPRDRLSLGDDDDLSTLSSTSNIYSVNNGSQYGGAPGVRRTSLGAEIFQLEDEVEIEGIMRNGYSRDMAVQIFKQRASELHRNGHRRGDSLSVSVSDRDKQRRKSQYTIDQRSDNDPSANPDHEALKMGLLLSQQESEYGINMYDSLIPADDPLIEEYLKMGLTMDEAVLKIFEYKFGKVSTLIADEPSPPPRPLTKKGSQYTTMPPNRPPENQYNSPTNNNNGYFTSPANSAGSNNTSFYNNNRERDIRNDDRGRGPMLSPSSSGSVRSTGPQSRPPMGPPPSEPYYQAPPQRPRADTDSVSSFGSSYNLRQTMQQEYVYPPPRLLTPAQASVDDRALEIAMLLSQQEAQFGRNMYEDITPQDDAEIRRLTTRGYTIEDATLAVFERKHNVIHNQYNQPPSQQMYPPNGGYPMSPTAGARLMTPVRQMAPDYRTTPVNLPDHRAPPPNEYGGGGGLHRGQSQYVQHNQQDYSMPSQYPPPPQRSGSMYNSPRPQNGNNQSFYDESPRVAHSNSKEAITLAIQQSTRDSSNRPGVERVPGIGTPTNRPSASTPVQNNGRPTSLNSNASSVRVSESDVQQLMSMGFSRDQSVHSLMQNNNNLEVALDRLLTGH